MNLVELLYPASETHNIFEATDDIHRAVMEHGKRSPTPQVGSDKVNSTDLDELVEPTPSLPLESGARSILRNLMIRYCGSLR